MMVDSQFRQSCELLVFLDRRGDLDNMRREAECFVRGLLKAAASSFPQFCYCTVIDVIELLDQFPELGETLIREPCQLEQMCGDLLHSCLLTVSRRMNGLADSVARCQLNVTLRLKCVPTTVMPPNQHHYSGLVSKRGLLTSVTEPAGYITYSVWTCLECEGTEVVLHHLPEHAPKCRLCKSTLFENSRLRRCGERVTATLGLAGQTLPVRVLVADELIQNLVLGKEHYIAGIVYKKHFHAWSVEVLPNIQSAHVIMPPGIKELNKTCRGVACKFLYSLASLIADDICPRHTFMHLKISLLLSLASLKGPDARSVVHVLAADNDSGLVARIMADAAQYADRAVSVGVTDATVADALIASSDGVCVLSLPIHTYTHKFTHTLIGAVEKKEIDVKDERVTLRSAVWAHGCDRNKFNFRNVASVFGTVCRGDGDEDDELAEFTVRRAAGAGGAGAARCELRRYLDGVRSLQVDLQPDAENLLKSYFLAARRDKHDGAKVMSAHALASLCRACARACGRCAAAADDALLAIWLHATGAPSRLCCRTPADLGQWDLVMEEFKVWLSDYIG